MNNRSSITRILLVSIAVIFFSLLYFFYPATEKSFYPACPFHALTGLHCPGCGSQRAVSALLKGDPALAAGRNILLVLSLPLVAYSGFAFTWNAFSTRKINQGLFYSPLFARLLLVVVVLFGILRNIPIYPFSLLAP